MGALAVSKINRVSLGQSIEWLGLRFSVPDDWEIVRHGIAPERGSLVLVDRQSQRLTVSWTACGSAPDLRRLVRDYRSKQIEREGEQDLESFRRGPFSGYRGQGPRGERLTRVVRYHAPHSRLIEVLFIEPEGSDERDVLESLLDGFEPTRAATRCRRFRAFGIDVTIPQGFRLLHADIKPMDASFEFTERAGKSSATLRRLGMAESWYDGDLVRLVAKHWPKRRLRRQEGVEWEGRSCVSLVGLEPTVPVLRLLGRGRVQRTLVWHSELENAVYELTTHSLRTRALLPTDFVVHGRAGGTKCS